MKHTSLLFLLYFSTFASSQQIKSTAALKKQIDNYIRSEMVKQQIPGVSYAVVSNGKIIDSGAYGLGKCGVEGPRKFSFIVQHRFNW